jgi:hypothetical protein
MTRLSPNEIRFFKKKGYLIKRRVMDENLMARARERLWENAPPEVDCNDPDTWVGPIKRYNEEGTGNRGSEYSWKYKGIGGEDWIVRMLATDPSIWGMAEQLLGEGNLVVPERIRGIYCLLPEGNIPQRPVTCHTDAHPFHLGVVGYIDDVPPNGGGFWVWPKSHRTFYYDYHTQHGNEQTEQYEKHVAFFNQQPYVDCHGGAGDIIFWHHRLGHSAGHNRSKRIRKAVLYDFCKKDLEKTTDEPPCEDMWRDWHGIHQIDADC